MAPIFNLDNEQLFWGLNILIYGLVYLLIGYQYANNTFERYFELDVDGFDGFRRRDMLLFPVMGLNYLTLDHSREIKVTILSTNAWIYLPIMTVFWPLKALSFIFWSTMILGACRYHQHDRIF